MQLVDNFVYYLSLSGPLDLLFMAVTHLGAIFALVVGRRLERLFAGFYLATIAVSWTVADPDAARVDLPAAFAILYLIPIAAVALWRGAPGWTLFVAAFQLVQVLTWMVALGAKLPVQNFALLTVLRAWEYMLIFALVIGAWQSRRSAPRSAERSSTAGAPDVVPG